MKVLICGSEGQLGTELRLTAPEGVEIVAYNKQGLDITNAEQVQEKIEQIGPQLVINAAAYTRVDDAETNVEQAAAVNIDGPANLAKACQSCSARLMHISTDYVFSGRGYRPYRTADTVEPVNNYGRTKLDGEQRVVEATKGQALIIRTSWLYSQFGHNFARTILNLLTTKNELRIVTDQVGTPTWARSLAFGLWRFADEVDVHGTYHWTNTGVASWYDFGVAIQEEALELGLISDKIDIIPVLSRDYSTVAARPMYSVLDISDTLEVIKEYPPHWRVSLREMLKEIKSNA